MIKGLIIQQQQQQQQQQVIMDQENMSNLTCASGDQASGSSDNLRDGNTFPQHYFPSHHLPPVQSEPPLKKKRNLPGNPDPEAEVIALSPKTLMATNRFICEVCKKGFQRDQNLQLHRRGHNLPWKLKQRTSKEVKKKVYICPEVGCIHHEASRALGDLTGIKKHFCRKHGEKKWKCDKCSKRYAVQSDWKAHSKTCGTREYRCDCGTLFSRRDSFITHRAFCDALAEESARAGTGSSNPPVLLPGSHHHHHQQAPPTTTTTGTLNFQVDHFNTTIDLNHFSLIKKEQNVQQHFPPPWLTTFPPPATGSGPDPNPPGPPSSQSQSSLQDPIFIKTHQNHNPTNGVLGPTILPPYHLPSTASAHMSATALLQKAAQMGATATISISSSGSNPNCTSSMTNMISSGTHHQDHVPVNSANTATTTTTGFGLYLSSRDHLLQLQGGPSSYFHQDMLMMNDHGSTDFDDEMVNSFLDAKKEEEVGDHQMRGNGGNIGGLSGGNDGMTRDFLSLKPLSHSDIMTMAGLTNSLGQDESQTPRSW